MVQKLSMNFQLFGLGQFSRPFLNADDGAGNGGSSPEVGDQSNNQNSDGGQKSFDDILKDSNYQTEFEKRMSEAIKSERAKWEADSKTKIDEAKTEAEKVAKMTAEQKAKYAEDKRLAELEKREKDITTRELRATAHETLAEKGLPKDLIDILNYTDAESCNKSIESVERAFQSAVQKAVNEKLRGKQDPRGGQSGQDSVDAALRAAMGLK